LKDNNSHNLYESVGVLATQADYYLTFAPSIGIIIADKNRLAGLFVIRTVVAPVVCWVQLGWKRKLPIDPRSNAGIFYGDKNPRRLSGLASIMR
jgi:hypothetical protein